MRNFFTQFLIISFVISGSTLVAQVGIGTATPQGALDINSATTGIVYPRIALTNRTTQSPVINPNGGSIEVGTTVYNTATTTGGSNDLYPGIYSWDGLQWIPQAYRKQYQKFEQSGGCQRTTIRESLGTPSPLPTNADNVIGLTGEKFTPRFSGYYRVEVRLNFAGGRIEDFTSGTESEISIATMEGAFFFTLSGSGVNIDPTSAVYSFDDGWFYTHPYSAENDIESPAVESNIVPHFSTGIYYLYLLAGEEYTFTINNCIITGNQFFVGNGDTGDGQGHIGHTIPCSVEFEYIGD